MLDGFCEKVQRFRESHLLPFEGESTTIVEFRSRDTDGMFRPLFDDSTWSYRGLDTIAGKNVDVVLEDPHDWEPIASASVGAVVSAHAFADARTFSRVLDEMHRTLKPDGVGCVIGSALGWAEKQPETWCLDPDGIRAVASHAGLNPVEFYTEWECDDPLSLLVFEKRATPSPRSAWSFSAAGISVRVPLPAIVVEPSKMVGKLRSHLRPGRAAPATTPRVDSGEAAEQAPGGLREAKLRMRSQLFFLGNKRSGTSVLAGTLNMHPEMQVTHESDIIWILYNLYQGKDFRYYPRDEPHSAVLTRHYCKEILSRYQTMSPLDCFLECQLHLIRRGTKYERRTDKIPVVFGDKKPNPHVEPEIIEWLQEFFPDARYLHIVRHPYDFLTSVPRQLPAHDMGLRWGSGKCRDPRKILAGWTRFEELVVQAEAKYRFPLHTVRFEDMCDAPGEVFSNIWKFSGLQIPRELGERIAGGYRLGIRAAGLHATSRGNRVDVPLSERTRAIMDLYGYQV